MRKIDWGGAGQIPEALGQDRCGSLLPINRYFFCFADRKFGSNRPVGGDGQLSRGFESTSPSGLLIAKALLGALPLCPPNCPPRGQGAAQGGRPRLVRAPIGLGLIGSFL